MDQAFGGGRKLRLALAAPVVDGDIVASPQTTIIPPGRRSEPEPLNNAEQHSFMIIATDDESGPEDSASEEITGDVVVERSFEPYFQQQQDMATIEITDDITVFDITVKTAGIVRFRNNTDRDIEVICHKQYPNSY